MESKKISGFSGDEPFPWKSWLQLPFVEFSERKNPSPFTWHLVPEGRFG